MTQRALVVLALLAAVGCGGGHAVEQRDDAKPQAASSTSGAERDFKPESVSPTHSPPPGEGAVPLAPIYPPGHSGLVDPAPYGVDETH